MIPQALIHDPKPNLRVRTTAKTKRRFLLILAAFSCTVLLSWPIFFSFSNWIFADKGSFLNLDYLLAKHLQLGVDTYYAYGLLPVLIQHLLFAVFGRGHWPMIGCTLVAIILFAVFWARLLHHMPDRRIWLAIVVLLSPTILWVNPNFPYSLVQLSMLFALLFVLEKRLDIAMAFSAIGCFSVPSLPLVLTALLSLAIVIDWWIDSDRSPGYLLRRLAPGVCAYVLLAALLVAIYGPQSVLVTALPGLGMKFYRTVNWGTLTALMDFVHPAGHGLLYYAAYYIATPVVWWLTSTCALFIFAVLGARAMIFRRKLDPRYVVVILCAVIQGVFAFAAYGSTEQHIMYDPILAAGVLIGLSALPLGRLRNPLLAIFVCAGILGQAAQARTTWLAWKNAPVSVGGATFYDKPAVISEWSDIVRISKGHRLLLLSYGTGVHHYFPTVQTADAWFMRKGEFFPADKDRLLSKLAAADVVVEEMNHPTSLIDEDEDIQNQLGSMCLKEATANFQIWWRRPFSGNGSPGCKVNLHRKRPAP